MSGQAFRLGDWLVEPARNRISKEKTEVILEARMMDALVLLASEAPDTVPTDKLLEELWSGQIVEASTAHRTINKLRTVLGDSRKESRYIETVIKRGYRVVANVEVVDEATHPIQVGAEAASPRDPDVSPCMRPCGDIR